MIRALVVCLMFAALTTTGAVPASAQINQRGVILQNEGTTLGNAVQLNCVGAGINCTLSGGVGILGVTGGGGGGGVTSLNTLTGDLTLATGTNSNLRLSSNGVDTLTLIVEQRPTFASVTVTSAAAGTGFASCVQINAAGILSNSGAACGTGSGGSTNPPVFIIAGSGISTNANVGSVTVTNTGVLSVTGTANQVITSGATGAITLSLPQSIATSSTPTFASISVTNAAVTGIAAGAGFASCVQVNSAGELSNAGAACGTSGGGGVTSLNSLTGALTLAAGSGLNLGIAGSTFTYTANGILSVLAGNGISVSGATGSVTITNTNPPVFISGGTGISVNANVGSVTVTNTGVTSLTGTANQVNVSAATGAVTLSLPQSIATSSTPTFASVTATNAAAGSTFASCVQVNAAGTLYNTGASCTTVNTLAGRLNIVAGSNVTVTTTPPDTISIAATGGGGGTDTYLIAGSGISVNAPIGSVTVTNTGVTRLNFLTGNLTIASGTTGPGITISSPTSANVQVDIANEVWSVATASVSVTNSASPVSTNLAFTLGSSATESWGFECTILASNTASNAQDMRLAWTLPSGVDGAWGPNFGSTTTDYWGVDTSVSNIALPNIAAAIQFGTAASNFSRTGLYVRGFIFGGGTGGQVLLGFAQGTQTSGQTVVLHKGSYCVFRRTAT